MPGIGTVQSDLTNDASMVMLIDRIIADTGRIEVLVNNAGYGSYGSLEDVPMAEARRQVEINVFALARLTQLVLPHMRAQRGGYVVNISSMGGKFGEPLGSWYHATKFAVEGLSDSIRPELAPFGINVVVIEPGAIRTEWGPIAAESVLADLREAARTPSRPQSFAEGARVQQRRPTMGILARCCRRRHRQGGHRASAADPLRRRHRRQADADRPRFLPDRVDGPDDRARSTRPLHAVPLARLAAAEFF